MKRGQRIRGTSRELDQAARAMRKEPTPQEAELWKVLRKYKRTVRFRRQHPLDRFVLDFYCCEKRLAIEVDGPIHEQQRERDMERDAVLAARGIRVLRFENREIDGQMESVLARISAAIHAE